MRLTWKHFHFPLRLSPTMEKDGIIQWKKQDKVSRNNWSTWLQKILPSRPSRALRTSFHSYRLNHLRFICGASILNINQFKNCRFSMVNQYLKLYINIDIKIALNDSDCNQKPGKWKWFLRYPLQGNGTLCEQVQRFLWPHRGQSPSTALAIA